MCGACPAAGPCRWACGRRDAHCPSFCGWWRVLRPPQFCMMDRCFRCRGRGHKIADCIAVTGLSDAAAMVANSNVREEMKARRAVFKLRVGDRAEHDLRAHAQLHRFCYHPRSVRRGRLLLSCGAVRVVVVSERGWRTACGGCLGAERGWHTALGQPFVSLFWQVLSREALRRVRRASGVWRGARAVRLPDPEEGQWV